MNEAAWSPEREYAALVAEGERAGAPGQFLSLARQSAEGGWRAYSDLLDAFPVPLAGRTLLDFGCKFGLLAPLALGAGCRAYVGLDVEEDYVATGRRLLGATRPEVRLERVDGPLLPLAPESVDLVLMNEVISHINPSYLETCYAEVARVLRRGGYLLVQDGNDISAPGCRDALVALYEAWENGPGGRRTDRDVVGVPYVEQRRAIIAAAHPSLAADRLDYLARNTSGLFGATLLREVERYLAGGPFHERPYRRGVCPTSPGPGGPVMERGFRPEQVVHSLEDQALEARVIHWPPRRAGEGLRGGLKVLRRATRYYARRALKTRGYVLERWSFRVLARKP